MKFVVCNEDDKSETSQISNWIVRADTRSWALNCRPRKTGDDENLCSIGVKPSFMYYRIHIQSGGVFKFVVGVPLNIVNIGPFPPMAVLRFSLYQRICRLLLGMERQPVDIHLQQNQGVDLRFPASIAYVSITYKENLYTNKPASTCLIVTAFMNRLWPFLGISEGRYFSIAKMGGKKRRGSHALEDRVERPVSNCVWALHQRLR